MEKWKPESVLCCIWEPNSLRKILKRAFAKKILPKKKLEQE